jgi:hypothetical protein
MVTGNLVGLRSERGRVKAGCVLFLLIGAALCYFAFPVGVQAFKYYQLADEMKTQVRFAATVTDQELERRIVDRIEEIGLPDEAERNLSIRRGGRPPEIRMETSYDITFKFPFYSYTFTYEPKARTRL